MYLYWPYFKVASIPAEKCIHCQIMQEEGTCLIRVIRPTSTASGFCLSKYNILTENYTSYKWSSTRLRKSFTYILVTQTLWHCMKFFTRCMRITSRFQDFLYSKREREKWLGTPNFFLGVNGIPNLRIETRLNLLISQRQCPIKFIFILFRFGLTIYPYEKTLTFIFNVNLKVSA